MRLLILLLPIAYAFYLYPDLPAQVPTHFGIDGNPDAWGDRSSIFLGPGIMGAVGVFMHFLFQNISKLDPKVGKTKEQEGMFKELGFGIIIFLSILALFIVHASAHPEFRIDHFLFSFIGLSFAIFGRYMHKLQPNYYAGFRLPWTLENADNWKYTHEIAGKFWFYGGLLQTLLCFILPGKFSIIAFLSIMFVMVLVPILFSYNFYRKNKN